MWPFDFFDESHMVPVISIGHTTEYSDRFSPIYLRTHIRTHRDSHSQTRALAMAGIDAAIRHQSVSAQIKRQGSSESCRNVLFILWQESPLQLSHSGPANIRILEYDWGPAPWWWTSEYSSTRRWRCVANKTIFTRGWLHIEASMSSANTT